jgi:predicted dehydrogenase
VSAERPARGEGSGPTPVRWGLLSTARINERTIAAARDSGRADIVAVAGRDLGRTRAYAREKGIEGAYGSYEELLADPAVEAVYVSLPNSLHAEWSTRALEAGKHVLCEKPFGRRAADAVAAFDAADANGVLLMEALMYRHHPQTRAMTELLESGAVGEPRFVRAVFAFNAVRIFGDAPNIRFAAELDGGALMDLGAYCVSAVRLIGGEPTRAYGAQRTGRSGVDVAFAGTLEYDSGLLASFECAFDVEVRSELEVLGTDGRLVVREPVRIETPGIEVWTPEGMNRVHCDSADPYRLQLDNFSAAIRGDERPLLGRDDAVGQARTLEALTESARTGSTVRV